jgi:hypothetical protein
MRRRDQLHRTNKNEGGPSELRSSKTESPAQRSHLPRTEAAALRYSTTRYDTSLQHNDDRDANSRMQQVKQEVLSIDVVDVAIVRVSPAHRPCVDQLKAVAAILEL